MEHINLKEKIGVVARCQILTDFWPVMACSSNLYLEPYDVIYPAL